MSDWRKTDVAEQSGCMILDDDDLAQQENQLQLQLQWRSKNPFQIRSLFHDKKSGPQPFQIHKKLEPNNFPFIKPKKYAPERKQVFTPLVDLSASDVPLSESK